MRRVAAGALAVAVLLAGCGSTVQTTGSGPLVAADGSVPGDGLGTAAGADGQSAGLGGGATGVDPATSGASTSSAGSASSGGSGGTGGPAAAVAGGSGGSGPGTSTGSGASGATGPIKVGFVNTKVGNAEAFGVNAGQTYTTDQVFRALVKAMNAQGGLAGREIVPVTADTDTASNDWARDFQAACERLTRDEPVRAVVGYNFAFLESFEACLAKAGVPHLSGAYTVGDDQSLRDFPTMVGTNALSADRRYRLQLEGAVREGFLTRENKLGLLLDACAPQTRAVKRTLEPFIKANGLVEAARTTMSCANGAGDVGSIAAQIQGAVLQFRQRGVDRVFIEGVPLIVFAQTAQSQGYYPGYLVTSTTGGGAIEPNVPAQQAANVHGYGWMPHIDVAPANQPPPTPQRQRCLSLLRSQGVVPSQYNDFHGAYTTCDGLFLYEAALQRTKGDDSAGAVIGAITSLGQSYAGVGLHSGRTTFSAQRRDAPTTYRPWKWVSDCRCFRFSGGEDTIS